MAYVKNIVYLIERKDPRTGHKERIQYLGDLRLKPKGWKVVGCLGKAFDEAYLDKHGLC